MKQTKLDDCNSGTHKWSAWFCCEVGLARECKSCREIDIVKSPWFQETEEDKIKWNWLINT